MQSASLSQIIEMRFLGLKNCLANLLVVGIIFGPSTKIKNKGGARVSTIDEVKARLDIVDIVSDTVTLKKSGRNFIGFCPFHSNTKTPSFVVFPETQTWRCFGACAEGGDLFGFVMKREGYDFKEALQHLAERAGVKLETNQPQQKDEQYQRLIDLNVAATAYFQKLLIESPTAANVRSYLAHRGLTAETIAVFQLGYALDEWEALKSYCHQRGYSDEDLLAAGLIVEREDGSSSYDRFRHRLMIPIRDPRGRVIGFGARALADNQVPKYLNSPQTQLFDKSATLYGLDLARSSIRSADQVVIVEGYMDVIQAYQCGAKNVVAQMGTALTEQQLKFLKRTTKNLVLALDADAAGNAAALRGLNVARETLDREAVPVPTARGLIRYESQLDANIRIAMLPPGKDPDDILREGLATWEAIIKKAAPVVDFYLNVIMAEFDLTTAKGKSAAVRELIPVLRDINNLVEREHYVQKLARLIQVDERTLMAEVSSKRSSTSSKRRTSGQAPTPTELPLDVPPDKVVTSRSSRQHLGSKLEDYCLSLILGNPAALAMANEILSRQNLADLSVNDLKHGDNREVFKSIQIWTASQTPKLETLTEMVGESLASHVANLVNHWHNKPSVSNQNIERDLSIAVLRLRLQNFVEQINELTFLQREMTDQGDMESARHYTQMVEQYRQQRRELEHIRDALSLIGQRRTETDQNSVPI